MGKRLEAVRALLHRAADRIRTPHANVLEEGPITEKPLIEMFQSTDTRERQRALDRLFGVLESNSPNEEETVNALVKIAAEAKNPGIRKHAISILDHFNLFDALKKVCEETGYLDIKGYVVDTLKSNIILASVKRAGTAAAVVQSEHPDAIKIREMLAGEDLLCGAGFATGTNDIIYRAIRTITELAVLYIYGDETNALAKKTLRELSECPDPLVKRLALEQLGFVLEQRGPPSFERLGRISITDGSAISDNTINC